MSNEQLPAETYREGDFTEPGYYAITICTHDFRWFFGRIIDHKMQLNERGEIAQLVWQSLPTRIPRVRLDEYVFMPNHMHGLIELMEVEASDPKWRDGVSEVVRTFKGATTYKIRHMEAKYWFAWQDGCRKSYINTDERLFNARQYIIGNPAKWREDPMYYKGRPQGRPRNG